MRKTTNKKATGLTKKAKTKVFNVFITIFAIVVMGGGIVWIGYGIYRDAKENFKKTSEYQESLPELGDSIPHYMVCMASNIYLGDRQREVSIRSKMYFACSEHCTHQLDIDSVRYAIDPVNHQQVDKSSAIVTLHPDKSGRIIYFESNETYNKYRQVLAESEAEK